MEALVELHNNIMFYLVIILFGSPISNKYLNHALILILIAFPSFKLLYLMDEVTDPNITILFIEYDSYLVPETDLEKGGQRLLEVDNRLTLPEETHIRFIVTAGDVIHGIKCDAYPGRLNQISVLMNRECTMYGQCSEICGILHSSMPIVIESLKLEKFLH
ncbi:uncharacterized protein K452DRAFT_330034 [Aplosporella prunicola CBS 121167]|uniref:Cytochrome c oxidase polypeptide II n=1 Tax=Aplosporella prunicola CBS 121167 TaxID=1176127 RepID=A0A6A6AZ86_9PEZI|nr:uncharacterized protein K452DRAFT_330034 [Aplosporella prunicola CBS 121167]KAF2135781.1 hypothetical protein K452DRAFT_330034 [Aplosporella prunicola CBS 121167]